MVGLSQLILLVFGNVHSCDVQNPLFDCMFSIKLLQQHCKRPNIHLKNALDHCAREHTFCPAFSCILYSLTAVGLILESLQCAIQSNIEENIRRLFGYQCFLNVHKLAHWKNKSTQVLQTVSLSLFSVSFSFLEVFSQAVVLLPGHCLDNCVAHVQTSEQATIASHLANECSSTCVHVETHHLLICFTAMNMYHHDHQTSSSHTVGKA